jgi:sugar phosphate permease
MQQPARSLSALDWLIFFLADVQSGLGPFLAVYLLTSQRWHEAGIGVVMTAAGIATLLAQTPAGAIIDATRWKRAMVIGAVALIGVACLVVTLAPSLAIVTAAQIAYNLAQGAVATLQGIGAAFSTTVAGFIVAGAGYDAAFLALAFIAVLAALLFLLAMPETMPETMPATAEAADLAAR